VDDELMRVRCLACGARLSLPSGTTYAACKKCGSEYLVSRRGGAYALQPISPDELALTREVAEVEREGEMGCANLALSMLAGVVILFCVIGGIGRFVLGSQAICVGSGVLALIMVAASAVLMLRNLERDRLRKVRLLASRPPLVDDVQSANSAEHPEGHSAE